MKEKTGFMTRRNFAASDVAGPTNVLQDAIAELRVKTVRYFRGLQRLGHAKDAAVKTTTRRLAGSESG